MPDQADRQQHYDPAAEPDFYPPTWLDYNDVRQVVTSTAAAAPGQTKFASSGPIGTRYTIISALAVVDKPSPTCYLRIGYAPGAVASEPDRQSGFNITMGIGSDPTNGKVDSFRMLSSTLYLGPFNIYVSEQNSSLYVVLDNSTGGVDTINCTIIWLIERNPTSVPPSGGLAPPRFIPLPGGTMRPVGGAQSSTTSSLGTSAGGPG